MAVGHVPAGTILNPGTDGFTTEWIAMEDAHRIVLSRSGGVKVTVDGSADGWSDVWEQIGSWTAAQAMPSSVDVAWPYVRFIVKAESSGPGRGFAWKLMA